MINTITNLIQTGFGASNLALEMNQQGLFNGMFMKNYKPITQGSPSGLIMPSTNLNINLPNIPNSPPLIGTNVVNPFGLPYLNVLPKYSV